MIIEFALASSAAGIVTLFAVVLMMAVVLLQVISTNLPRGIIEPETARSVAEGPISAIGGDGSLRRWHIVAVICALVPLVIWGTRFLYVGTGELACDSDLPFVCILDLAQLEVAFLLLIAALPVALFYLDRLHLAGVRDAVVLAFGMWAIPRAVFAEAVDLNLPFAIATALGIAGMVGSLFMRADIRRTMLRLASLVAILVPMSTTLTLNSPVVLVGFPVTALLIGYGVYRIEWKSRWYGLRRNGNYAVNPNDAGATDIEGLKRAKLKGRSLFVAGVVAAVVMSWLLNFSWDRIGINADQGVMVLLAVISAVAVAWVMYRVARNFAVHEIAMDRALSVAVVTITASAVFHALGLPPVVDVSAASDSWFAWNCLPFVAIVASIGALLMVVTTLTRWMLQLRPFLVGMMWLVWAALPATEVNMYDPVELALPQLILGAVIAGTALWLMWYGFGPGRASVRLRAG